MPEDREEAPPVSETEATALARVQAGSGLVFGLFLVVHLVTTISAAGGIPAYDRTLVLLRNLYRPSLFVELLLVALSGTVHVGCAVGQMVRRRRQPIRRMTRWLSVHRLSGYFLLASVAGHAAATRALPTLGTGPTATGAADFAYLAYAVLGWPWFFAPYYLLLGLCGATHLGLGVRMALPVLIPRRVTGATPSRRYLLGLGAFALLVTGGIGAIITRSPSSPRRRFAEYHSLYERAVPFLLRYGSGPCASASVAATPALAVTPQRVR